MWNNKQYTSDGEKSGRAPERSKFAQTCSLLSQYLKERGSLRDLNIGINSKFEAIGRPEPSPAATIDFVSSMEKPGQLSTQPEKSMDPLPQYATVDSLGLSKETAMEPKNRSAQLTIFYEGQVLVFDEFPAEKAREVMLLANKGGSTPPPPPPPPLPNPSGGSLQQVSTSNAMDNSMASASNTGSNPAQELRQPQPQSTTSDLPIPIARRASLHKFLEKRKDRANARAPYQLVHNTSGASPNKHVENFDLNL